MDSRYKPITYLRADGVAYIDTGYAVKSTTKIECKAYITSDYSIFGYYQRVNLTGSSGVLRYYDGGGTYWNTGISTGTTPHTWIAESGGLYCDGNLISSNPIMADRTDNIYLFARNNNGPNDQGGTCCIWYFKVWENNVLVREYIPVLDIIDKKTGMYETVTDTFYGSGNSTDFYVFSWYFNEDGELDNYLFIEPVETYLVHPYPANMWYEDVDDNLTTEAIPEAIPLGAFTNTNITSIQIPQSCKYLGADTFVNTNLTSVTIASDCTYFPTTFPPGCQINFYPT